jgi:hypothetical protein
MKVRDLPFTPTSPPPSRGRKELVIGKDSPPLVLVLRSLAAGGTEDGGGVGACPVRDTGGGWGRIFVCLVVALLLLAPTSCGRKAKPFLSQKSTNATVLDLKGAWQAGYVELRGTVSDSLSSGSALTGARVHYAVYPANDPPCDGCPIEFEGFHTYGSEVIQEGRFYCKIPGALKGNVYYFEVRLLGEKGSLGPLSNRAKVVVE